MRKKGAASAEIQVQTLEGTVSVAFKRVGKEWHAIALQFDIVGTGKTRAAALLELQDLFELYLCEVLNATGRVRFYNPSDKADWDIKDKQHFHVVMVVSAKHVAPSQEKSRPSLDNLTQLRPIRAQIQRVQFHRVYV